MSFAYTPGTKGVPDPNKPGIFLGGSIEMGKAEDWQSFAQAQFDLSKVNVFNPRWDFDPTTEQSMDNPAFAHQVNWELYMIERADCVLMVLQKDTKSPISLMEIGIIAGANGHGALNKMIISCPEGFWRKGNVDIVAQRYRIPVINDPIELFSEATAMMMRNWQRRTERKTYLEST